MNFLHPPFDNVKVRRAALLAMNQKDVLDALVGNPEYYKICGAVFVCGTPLATDVGSETLVKGNGMAEAKKLLAESGYDGTPDRDHGARRRRDAEGAADRRRAVAARRRLQGRPAGHRLADRGDPPRQPEAAEGGRLEHVLHQLGRRRRGPTRSPTSRSAAAARMAAGSAGRKTPRSRSCATSLRASSSPEEQKKIAAEIQKEAYDQVIYIPLGQYLVPSAWRKSLTGVLDGPATPVFWNIDKSE